MFEKLLDPSTLIAIAAVIVIAVYLYFLDKKIAQPLLSLLDLRN